MVGIPRRGRKVTAPPQQPRGHGHRVDSRTTSQNNSAS